MNRQDIFNRIVTHLRAQGGRAFEEGSDNCLYRGPFGRKCAIGALIADKHYTLALESLTPHSRSVRAALAASGVDIQVDIAAPMAHPDVLFLTDAQTTLHDNMYSAPEDFAADLETRAEAFAAKYSLVVPV